MKVSGIIIHHSATKDGKVVDYNAIRRYHMIEKKWSDIGYHFVIENVDGKIKVFSGRPLDVTGAHCVGKNSCIGICCVGNYDVDDLPDEILSELVTLCNRMMAQFKLKKSTVEPHNKYAPKTCPGKKFPWDKFMSLLCEPA